MSKKERTEEDKLCKAPIEVVLGGAKYQVKPLVIRDSRVWRGKVAEELGMLPRHSKATTDDDDAWATAMNMMLKEMPDKVIDLFFEYAKDLNKDEIEAVATDAEIAKAFEEVVAVAFPLTGSILGVLGKTTKQQ